MNEIAREFLSLLKHHPGEVVTSQNDTQCVAVFEGLGMLEHFGCAATPHCSVVRTDALETHYLVGIRWSGHAQPSGNGYQILALPKQGMSKEGFQQHAEMILEICGGHHREDRTVLVPPPAL